MWCEIYRSSKNSGAYLYIEEEGNFSRVPETLLNLLGRLEHVMRLELTPQRSLAQADVAEVRRNLAEKDSFCSCHQKHMRRPRVVVMGKAPLNLIYLGMALVFIVVAWLWKIWPLIGLAVAAIAAVFIKRRTR